jgi:L-threonylcarbamoyladenylate synthase
MRSITVDPLHPDAEALQEAAAILREGGTVAFPTETVYGLGADAGNPEALQKVFEAKGRPPDNPLIVHVAALQDVRRIVAEFPDKAKRLAERFWPGPLTLVLPKTPAVAQEATCNLPTVGVRIPQHPVALALLKAADIPVAAPSANLSGKPSPTTAEAVREDLAGRIDLLVDGGPAMIGLESTVLDMTSEPPTLLRPGGVTREAIEQTIGPIAVAGETAEKPASPGMKYTHYAPRATVTVVSGAAETVHKVMLQRVQELRAQKRSVGVLCSEESRHLFPGRETVSFGTRSDLNAVARGLFSALRYFDQLPVEIILAEGVPETGVGHAIMNRLRKAAGGREEKV